MNIFTKAKSLVNLGLRVFTLGFRFILSFYIVKYLGLEATGIFGLAVGIISFAPAFVGWGLNYFTSRDVVGLSPLQAGTIIKTRLVVTTVSLAAVTAIGSLALLAVGFEFKTIYLLILVLLWLETYALDVHLPLIAQEMPIQANVLIFIRSALWVPFVIGAGLLFPAFRSIEWVFTGWILAYIPAIVALAFFLRQWPLDEITRSASDLEWVRKRLRGAWLIYISDLCLVGLMYADRYIVNFVLGLTMTGVYTFFWTLTNALQTLVNTAVVQVSLPALFKAYSSGNLTEWRGVMRRQLLKTAGMAVVLGCGVFLLCEILIRFMGMQSLAEHRLLFVFMLCAAIIRSCSDLLSVGLTSMHRDRYYALIIMVGVVLSVLYGLGMMTLAGLNGAGFAAIMTALTVAGANGFFLFFSMRRAERDLVASDNSEGLQPGNSPKPKI